MTSNLAATLLKVLTGSFIVAACDSNGRPAAPGSTQTFESPATPSEVLPTAPLQSRAVVLQPNVGITPASSNVLHVPRVLWESSVDLDGDGSAELMRLVSQVVRTRGSERADEEAAIPVRGCDDDASTCIATLHVGEAERQLPLTPGYFGGIDLSTIDIDARDKRKELLYRRRAPGHVDPPFIFSVGIYYGGQLHWQELETADGYDAGTATTSGNGILTTEYDACSEVTTTAYRLTKTGLTQVSRVARKARDPNQCAACPFVYVKIGDRFVRQGEILRNLGSVERNAHQSLPLDLSGAAQVNGMVHVQLREEKPETTYLDSVWLSADGRALPPVACDGQSYCNTDNRFHRIAPGERLDLYFAVPPTAEQVRLEAVGHYIPSLLK